MKVLQINIFGNLSTGRIAVDIYRTLISEGHQGVIAFARNSVPDDVPYIKIGNNLGVYCDGVLTRLTDRAGFFSRKATRKLIKEIQEYNPDIIHLHNLHGYYINVEILFEFLKQYGKPVVWTLHDCWALRDIVATTVWWDARNGLMVVMIVSKFMHILKVCLSITQKITIEKNRNYLRLCLTCNL